MELWIGFLVALIGGIPGIISAAATFLGVIPDAKRRRRAASGEHVEEMELLKEIRRAQKNRESREVKDLKRRVVELEERLAEAQTNQ